MSEIIPVTKDQLFEKKIAENTGSDYSVGDISNVVPVTKDQALLKEIALNSAGQSGVITELEGKVADNTSAIEAIVDVNAGYNLLPCSAISQTIEGVTWTVYSNGIVTASGTSTANGSILTYHRFTSECVLNGKEVILKGCPVGGGASSYSIAGFRVAGSSSYLDNREEYGEGVRFTWNNDSSQVVPEIQLAIAPNYAIQGTLTFKPMLYDARLNPTGYVPYAMTNRELTDAVNRGSVFVTGDGVKTYSQLLNELHNLIDRSRLTKDTKLVLHRYGRTYVPLVINSPDGLVFCGLNDFNQSGIFYTFNFYLTPNDSLFVNSKTSATQTTFTDDSSAILQSGYSIAILY